MGGKVGQFPLSMLVNYLMWMGSYCSSNGRYGYRLLDTSISKLLQQKANQNFNNPDHHPFSILWSAMVTNKTLPMEPFDFNFNIWLRRLILDFTTDLFPIVTYNWADPRRHDEGESGKIVAVSLKNEVSLRIVHFLHHSLTHMSNCVLLSEDYPNIEKGKTENEDNTSAVNNLSLSSKKILHTVVQQLIDLLP